MARVKRRFERAIGHRAGAAIAMLAAIVLLMGFAGMALAETGANDGAADQKAQAADQAVEKTDITIKAKWADGDDEDGLRPESVTVQLMADGKIAKDAKDKPIVVTLRASNDWKQTVKDVVKASDGKAIKYTVALKAVDKYTSTIKEAKAEKDKPPVFEITFAHEASAAMPMADGSGEKAADDDNGKADEPAGDASPKAPAAADDDAPDEPAAKDDAAPDEPAPAGDKAADDEDEPATAADEATDGEDAQQGATVTLAETTIAITKAWDDGEDADGVRPESITVNLTDGESVISTTTLTAQDEWTGAFADVPQPADGVDVEYAVTEEEVDGYELTKTEGDAVAGFKITNTHEVQKSDDDGKDDEKTDDAGKDDDADTAETTDDSVKDKEKAASDSKPKAKAEKTIPTCTITATKVWKDKDNAKKTRANVTLHLQKKVNGEWKTITGQDRAIAANAAGQGLTVTWTGLPAEDDNGKAIEYRVTEGWMKNYTSKVTGDMKSGFTVTNTLGRIPKTGDSNGPGAAVAVVLVIAAAGFFAATRRTRKE